MRHNCTHQSKCRRSQHRRCSPALPPTCKYDVMPCSRCWRCLNSEPDVPVKGISVFFIKPCSASSLWFPRFPHWLSSPVASTSVSSHLRSRSVSLRRWSHVALHQFWTGAVLKTTELPIASELNNRKVIIDAWGTAWGELMLSQEVSVSYRSGMREAFCEKDWYGLSCSPPSFGPSCPPDIPPDVLNSRSGLRENSALLPHHSAVTPRTNDHCVQITDFKQQIDAP